MSPFIRRPQQIPGGTEVSGGAYARQTAAFNVVETQQLTPQMLNMLLQPQTTELLLQWVFLTPLQAETYCIRNANYSKSVSTGDVFRFNVCDRYYTYIVEVFNVSVPYGSYFGGRSRYGTPGYHFAESDISGTAGVSQTPTLTFTPGPGNCCSRDKCVYQGNHIFQQSTNINGVSATNADYRRVRLGIPLAISEGSGSLVYGTQVDQAETFILVTSGHTATGNQIDQGQVSISLIGF